jgi:hypothetical protein
MGIQERPLPTKPKETSIMKTRRIGFFAVLICLAFGTGAALAEFPEGVPDKIQVDLGGTFANLDTNFGVTSSNAGVGAIVSLEDVMNLGTTQSTWRIDGNWRFTERQHLDFGYFQYNRTGSRVNPETFTWGEYTFNEGNTLDGKLDSSFTYAAYRYDFLSEPRVRISGSAGVSYIDMSPSLSGTGTVGTPDGEQTGTFSTSTSLKLPVPLLGLQLNWALGKQWEIQWFARFLFINMPDLSGGVSESTLRGKWHFTKHLGAALGYDREEITLRRYKNGDQVLKGGYSIRGWSAYLTMAF